MPKTALITGITGQDGAYLSRLLVERGYSVFGTSRTTATCGSWRLRELGVADSVRILTADMTTQSDITRVIDLVRPDECYNLAAQSYVGASFEQPVETANATAMSVINLLETLRNRSPHTRFYQASSSEMFGVSQQAPQNEKTPFNPQSPYAVSKLFGHFATVNYRQAFGLFACSGILFNHESPLRAEGFVTRKIAAGLAQIAAGRNEPLRLGNVDAKRDWGFAGDYAKAIYLMLQQDEADEFVIATGTERAVRDFVTIAGAYLNMEIEWSGSGLETMAVDRRSGNTVAVIDPRFFRAIDVEELRGDATKAERLLGWRSETSFESLVELMVRAEVDRLAGATAHQLAAEN